MTCSRVNGSNVKIWLRLNSGELIAKNGFCVVAPMRMMRPFLDIGQQHVLLGAVEAVQFIEEEDGARPAAFELAPGFVPAARAPP